MLVDRPRRRARCRCRKLFECLLSIRHSLWSRTSARTTTRKKKNGRVTGSSLLFPCPMQFAISFDRITLIGRRVLKRQEQLFHAIEPFLGTTFCGRQTLFPFGKTRLQQIRSRDTALQQINEARRGVASNNVRHHFLLPNDFWTRRKTRGAAPDKQHRQDEERSNNSLHAITSHQARDAGTCRDAQVLFVENYG